MYILNLIKLILLKKRFRKINKHNEVSIANYCDLSKIVVGNKSYGQINISDFSLSEHKLYIGSYCSIAHNVHFLLGGEHQLYSVSTFPFKVKVFGASREAGSKGDIVVGDDVWIGECAIICSGVTIGQGAVVAAGAVVTKNVEAYSVVGGNPAHFIKWRFDEQLRTRLLTIDLNKLFDTFTASKTELIYSNLTNDILDTLLEN